MQPSLREQMLMQGQVDGAFGYVTTIRFSAKLAGIELDRKMLADIAVRDADTFRRFADRAREALAAG